MSNLSRITDFNSFTFKSTNNSKTYQTQSLSNIASPALIHSNSDNEINPMKLQKSRVEADNEFIIAYKDDFSFTSEDNLHDSSSDKVRPPYKKKNTIVAALFNSIKCPTL